jgi:UbiD family decarboxylase
MEMDLRAPASRVEPSGAPAGGGVTAEAAAQGPAPRDLREWLERVEATGGLRRITAEVDWDQEMSAITYLAQQRVGAPALLFENVRGYGPGHPALWNALGSSLDRIALAVGLPAGTSATALIAAYRDRMKRRLAPVTVAPAGAPIHQNVLTGDAVDVLRFPVPRHWPRDGGRYGGTCDVVITRDPDGGWLNLGTYRMMVHDRNTVGLYLSPGKDARLHLERARSRGQDLEVVACWGVPPAMFMVGSQSFPKTCSELDALGGLLGSPVELVPGVAVGLPVPARAEIALEGVIRPDANRLEGPFGEFTGYYGRPEDVAPFIEVKAVRFRDRPILTNALMADYPACEQSLFFSVIRSARIWDDLDTLGVPGIRGVYCHPAAAAGFGMTIVSLEQRYAGHAPQVLALAAQCPGGAYYSKWIVAVDEDVEPSDINQVLWAMATRCNPSEDIDILRQTWSTWLDPTQNPPEERPWGSKALINACMEHRYKEVFSPRTVLARSVYERVRARWAELGLPDAAPAVRALEEDRPAD